jgi:hypothetical protein
MEISMKWLTNILHSVANIKKERNTKPVKSSNNKDLSDANAIHVIHPYKSNGIWMFDDADKNVSKEPFVSGADEILDIVSNYQSKCTVLFSDNCFPGNKYRLKKTFDEGQGAWYMLNEIAASEECKDITNIKHGWLCAVVKYYFQNNIPDEIYIKVN